MIGRESRYTLTSKIVDQWVFIVMKKEDAVVKRGGDYVRIDNIIPPEVYN